MGLGIVEPKRATDSHVPGTSYLYEDSTGSQGTVPVGAKHDSGSDAPVILVPQPSDSPNDPLVSPTSCWAKRNSPLTARKRIGQNGRESLHSSPSATQLPWALS